MKRFLFPVLFIAYVGAFSYACSGTVGKDCTQNAKKVCTDGVTYWQDSCGKPGQKVADCACGCNSDFTSCEQPCNCTPECGSRECGLDPVCGTVSCGTCSGVTPACNTATGVCEAALKCPTITGSRDAIIKQNAPDANFGHVDYVEVGFISNGAYRSFSQFDLDSPAGTAVQSASLRLFWRYSSSDRSTPTELEVYRVDKSWAENSLSWNMRDVIDAWDNPGGDWRDRNDTAQGTTPYASLSLPVGNAANDYLSLEITQLVQDWVDGTQPNYGLLLKASNAGETTANSHVQFVGLEDAVGNNLPRLVIATATCVDEQVATPVFSPPAGTYSAAQEVSISTATAGGAIHFTIHGSEPTESSALYSEAITISSTTTIKAKAFKSGMLPSAIVSATYVIGAATAGAILWDSMTKELQGNENNYYAFTDSKAWPNRANWKQVPHGTVNYSFVGDPLIEDGVALLHLQSGYVNGPMWHGNLNTAGKFIKELTDAEAGDVGESGEIYGSSWYASGSSDCVILDGEEKCGFGNYYPNNIRIIKNQADEITLEADMNVWFPGKNIARYRFRANSGWLELSPVTSRGVYDFGIHSGPHKWAGSPAPNEADNDWVLDTRTVPCPGLNQSCPVYPPRGSEYVMGQIVSSFGQSYNMLVRPKDISDASLVIEIYNGGSYIGLGQLRTVASNTLNNKATYVAAVNRRNVIGGRNAIDSEIAVGGSYTAVSELPIAGRWRISGKVNGVYHTQTRDARQGENLVFTSPVSGLLTDIMYYLYDRSAATPLSVNTPQDIHRSIGVQ